MNKLKKAEEFVNVHRVKKEQFPAFHVRWRFCCINERIFFSSYN